MPGTVKAEVRTYQNFVNGEWVAGSSGETFPVYDPSTEEVIAQVPSSNAADVDHAVKAARAAFDSGPWGQTNAAERGRILFKLAEKIRQTPPCLRNSNPATQASPLSKPNSTSPTWPPASNITEASPTKLWAM